MVMVEPVPVPAEVKVRSSTLIQLLAFASEKMPTVHWLEDTVVVTEIWVQVDTAESVVGGTAPPQLRSWMYVERGPPPERTQADRVYCPEVRRVTVWNVSTL